jgi:hypothetical protein
MLLANGNAIAAASISCQSQLSIYVLPLPWIAPTQAVTAAGFEPR